ncbi:MAG: Trm112 family protein [Phycisphaerae bacterium]
MSQKIDPELLSILACPESKAPLIQVGDWLYSTDPQTRRRYPVRDGIPIMLIDESEVVDPDEFNRIMAEHGKARPG